MSETIVAPVQIEKPNTKIEGWLALFIVRFYISSLFAFSSSSSHSRLWLFVGIAELTIALLLSFRKKMGVLLARTWLVLEAIFFGSLGALALMAPTDMEGAMRSFAYSVGAAILAAYFFRSKRVKSVYGN